MRKGWVLFVLGWALILGGGFWAHAIQTSGGIKVSDVRFAGARGVTMSALLYVPANATATTPAPGILAVHGYINSRETQDGFAIEFARRGYVVLALDQTGHGYSDPPAYANGFGGPDGLKYLRSLPMVDVNNIGLEGHSMGGWTVLAAAKAMPDAYKALVLEGSSTGPPFAADGSPAWPRNLALVYSQFDEFSKLMWGVDRARDVVTSPKLMKVFGAAGPLTVGHVYGDANAGTARVLYTPAVTHPGDHISADAIGYAAGWFARTLKGGTLKPDMDQIWIWKEIGTLIALVGFVALMLGTFELLLRLPWFERQRGMPVPVRLKRDRRWWLALALAAAVPVLTYYPFFKWGAALLPASILFRQTITSQIMVWAVLNAGIAFALGLLLRGPGTPANTRWIRSVIIAVATVGMGYVSLIVTDALFKTDYRFWVVAVKLMTPAQWTAFAIYLAPFTLFFGITLRATHANLAVVGDSAAKTYLSIIGALAGGFAVFLAAEYIPLFTRDQLLTPSEPLNTVVAMQFLPLMAIVAVISAFTWRRTNSTLPGALICGLLVTWYIVAGTATHWAPGMPPWPTGR
jgi:pimeloyl-ACP methyl ester carboxylesterase